MTNPEDPLTAAAATQASGAASETQQPPGPLEQPVNRGELVAWYPICGGRKMHAFAQDPETNAFRLIPICRKGLVAGHSKTKVGPSCSDCERILRFIHSAAQKHREIGRKEGRALGYYAVLATEKMPPADETAGKSGGRSSTASA
jgi:hypothetical protein